MTNDESADEQLESRRFWRRVRRFVLYPLLSLLLLVAITVGWLSARNAAARKQVDDLVEQMRAQGLPYDNASLSAYRDRMTSTKDLTEWLQVLTTVESDEFRQSSKDLYPWDDAEAPLPGDPWPEQEDAQAFLEQWQELLQRAQRLAQADVKRRTPLNTDGIHTILDWETKVRQLARLFQLQAAEAIYRRDSAATRDALLSLLGSARSVEGQPIIVGQLIAVAAESIAIEQLQRALEFNVLNAEDLKRVRERLEQRTAWQTFWQLGIAGERALLLPAFVDTDRYLGEDARPFSLPLPWRARDELSFLQLTNRSAELPTEDLAKFRDANQALNEELGQLFRKGNWTTHFDNMITNLVLPAYGAYGEALVQREMRCRLAVLAIGVREYQAKFGKLPDALEDLSQIGIDATKLTPPGGKPFGFRKLDSSVALWGFQSRTIESTPDDPPDITAPDHQWDRMWLWQMEQ